MKKTFPFLALAIISTACFTSNYVVSTYTPVEKNELAQYKTFAYMDFSKGADITPKMLSAALMAKSAINFAMQLRGYTLADSKENADMLINLGTFTDMKHEKVTDIVPLYPNLYSLYWGQIDYAGWYNNVSFARISHIETYQEGVLLIDLVDTKKKILLWHGSVNHVLANSIEDINEEKVTSAVSALFKEFPIPAMRQNTRSR